MNESLKAEDIIRQYGLKLTQPRLKVLRLLLSRQEVLTADEIYEALVKEGTSLNFSTVYRTLETFTDEKITEKVQMPQSRKAGFLLFTMSHTHNLICLGCHKVIHIHGCPLHDFSEDLAKKTDFDIVGHDLTLYGYCTNCQKKKGRVHHDAKSKKPFLKNAGPIGAFCRNRFPKDFFPIWWELPIKGAAAGMDRCCPFMQRFLQRPLPLFCPIFIGLRPCLRKSVRLKKRRNRWPSFFWYAPRTLPPSA